jgi:hypothetical protein
MQESRLQKSQKDRCWLRGNPQSLQVESARCWGGVYLHRGSRPKQRDCSLSLAKRESGCMLSPNCTHGLATE